jgi:hypothetical protein
MIVPLAHIAHWYSASGFLLPVLGVIIWLKILSWRERRAGALFAEFWTLGKRDGRWVLVALKPDAGAPRRGPKPPPTPWSEEGHEAGESR